MSTMGLQIDLNLLKTSPFLRKLFAKEQDLLTMELKVQEEILYLTAHSTSIKKISLLLGFMLKTSIGIEETFRVETPHPLLIIMSISTGILFFGNKNLRKSFMETGSCIDVEMEMILFIIAKLSFTIIFLKMRILFGILR